MPSLRSLIPAALILLALCGCSSRATGPAPLQPEPPGYALTGRVRITAVLTAETTKNGAEIVTGHRVVDDASGVRVWLLRPDGSMDSVLTRQGAFEFRAEEPGLYRAFFWVIAPDTVAASDLMLGAADAAFPDTLKVGRSPGLSTYPNPFDADGMGMEGIALDPQQLVFRILATDGTPVWTRTQDWPGASFTFHYHWIGDDDGGHPASHGMYWALVDRDGAHFHSPVFRE